jgi:hypothetical protein
MKVRLQPPGQLIPRAMQLLRTFGVWRLSTRPATVVGCLVLGFSLFGCAGPKAQNKSSSIDQLHLLVTPVALNLDDKPGPDGVGVRVYASRRERAEALPITSGTLDLLMFDDNVTPEQLFSAQPRRTWSYAADKLKGHIQETTIGISYRFAASWGEDKPAAERITFVARYTSSSSNRIYSAPSSVQLSLK